ncbi:hypothetical protein L3X37_07370 [Sabulilitoribacter arenilitoris]|uniref:YhhN-like protein n=1 Tax=Wocania arenilitoris TaxID=2044858 RepID=A0AAE3ENF1_9FLAO|nr:hypothetical protein [Wocania arenilitoris]MCF7568181.1 hypothetical protein [Wocania arenilitoris]
MKNSSVLSFNKVFFCALLLLVSINILGTYSEDILLLQSTKALFIPVLLILFFIKHKALSIPFISFFIFSFLGDVSLAFFDNGIFIKASSVFYFLSYMCLIGLVISKFNFFRIDKVIGAYLILVFLINAYFLYTFYGILKAVVPDSLEVTLFGVKNISLILLMFLAFGKYLANDTKSSILFLMVALCLVFSTILNYVSIYYVYSWILVMLERVIYAIGIYLLINYTIEENKSLIKQNNFQDSYKSDNIFA